MHRNRYWLLLLFIIGLLTVGYSSVAAYQLASYLRASQSTYAQVTHIEARPYKSDRYILWASYHFNVDGRVYSIEGKASPTLYNNIWSAQEAAKKLANSDQQWKAWYPPHHPELSSLVHCFPFKNLLSAVAVIGVFLYFVWLGRRVASYSQPLPPS